MHLFIRFFIGMVFLALFACTSVPPSAVRDGVPIMVYRGGALQHDGPLDIQDHYSFRFVDKWRISFSWLSGPVEVAGCSGLWLNSFRRLQIQSELSHELNPPFLKKDNRLYMLGENNGKWSLSEPRERVYGTDREGKFTGYSAFCGDGFKDSFDNLRLYIVQPDPAKRTSDWIEGAQAVTINGLHWLHKEMPIQNWEGTQQLNAPIEYWVLKIPDTQYWMMLRFSASSGSKYGRGAGAHPEKHRRLLDLFHQIIESVKLDPITPINMDSFTEAAAENQRQKALSEQMLTSEEKMIRLHCITEGSIWRAFDPRCR